MTVISLAKAREEREPHWSGECICLACQHKWVGVGPMDTISGLECPSCSLPQGHTRHPFGAPDGALLLVCKCGSEALTAYKSNGHFWVKCMACGTDQTEVFFDG